jgi:hypothetical protein
MVDPWDLLAAAMILARPERQKVHFETAPKETAAGEIPAAVGYEGRS